jgi:hypothetical protein
MRRPVMTSETYRGVVRGGTVVLLDREPPLTDGTEVVVTPVATAPGPPAAVLAAMQAAPHVPAAWVDELEALMAAGRRPPNRNNPFEDENRRVEGS